MSAYGAQIPRLGTQKLGFYDGETRGAQKERNLLDYLQYLTLYFNL